MRSLFRNRFVGATIYCLCILLAGALTAQAEVTVQTENVRYTVTEAFRYGDVMRLTLTVEPLHDGIRIYDRFDAARGIMDAAKQGIADCIYEIWDDTPSVGMASSQSTRENGVSALTLTSILAPDVPASFEMELSCALRKKDTQDFQDEVVLKVPVEMAGEAQEWRVPLAFTDEERAFNSLYVTVSPLAAMVQILYTNNQGNEDGYLGFAVLDEEGNEFRGEGIADWELPDQPGGQLLSYALYPPVDALPNPFRLWIRDPGYVLVIDLATGQCQTDTL